MSKQLIDGTEVPDSLYYYILDYHDRCKQNNKLRWFVTPIHQLNKDGFKQFVSVAIEDDLKNIKP